MDWKFVLVLIFSLLVAVFTMQNADAVDVRFLTFQFTQVSEALVILISAAAGALIALLLGAIRWVKDKTKLMGAKKSIANLEIQVRQLKIMLDAEVAKNAKPAVETEIVEADPGRESAMENPTSEPDTIDERKKEEKEEPAPKRKWYQI